MLFATLARAGSFMDELSALVETTISRARGDAMRRSEIPAAVPASVMPAAVAPVASATLRVSSSDSAGRRTSERTLKSNPSRWIMVEPPGGIAPASRRVEAAHMTSRHRTHSEGITKAGGQLARASIPPRLGNSEARIKEMADIRGWGRRRMNRYQDADSDLMQTGGMPSEVHEAIDPVRHGVCAAGR